MASIQSACQYLISPISQFFGGSTRTTETSVNEEPRWALDASEFRVDGNLVFSPELKAGATFERCRVGGDLDLSDLQIDIGGSTEDGPAAPSVFFSDSIIDRRIAVTLPPLPSKEAKPAIKVLGKKSPEQTLFCLQRPHIKLNGVEVGILADDGGKGWGGDVKLT